MTESAKPGWYPLGDGGDRYWDGREWTQWTRSPAEAAAERDRLARLDAKARKQDARDERRGHAAASSDGGGLSSLVLTDTTIRYRGEGGDIAGSHASVETVGEIERRITATRLVATGVLALAWRKRADNRELYLTVEGTSYAFVIPLDPKQAQAARALAARINNLAAKANPARLVAEPEPAPFASDDDLPAKLQQLATLHASGALTDAEFTAAKARLLG